MLAGPGKVEALSCFVPGTIAFICSHQYYVSIIGEQVTLFICTAAVNRCAYLFVIYLFGQPDVLLFFDQGFGSSLSS